MSLSSCRQSIIWRNLINPVYILQSPITLSLDISIACIETKPPDTDWQWLESGHHSNTANLESSGHRRSDLFVPAQSPALYRQIGRDRHTLGQVFLVTTCHGLDSSNTLLSLSWLGCSLWRLFWFWSQRPMWKYRLGQPGALPCAGQGPAFTSRWCNILLSRRNVMIWTIKSLAECWVFKIEKFLVVSA